jgi:hypothetical protein
VVGEVRLINVEGTLEPMDRIIEGKRGRGDAGGMPRVVITRGLGER